MPDCGAGFIEWTKKAELKEMRAFFKSITIDDRLQILAKESENGDDIGDWLIRYEAPAFTVPPVELIEPAPEALPAVVETPFWENVPQISDAEFKRNCEVLDWWNKRLDLPIDGT